MPGEELELDLRLKLMADAALVGLPNAGKSSLLRRISNAKPKVADYPFTTLAPVLGTVDSPSGRQLTVADVPGLIEGASEGVGLGHEFLAHLERARLLVHVIDAAEGDPADRFALIDNELSAYGAGLDRLPQIVVLNKVDVAARCRSTCRTTAFSGSSGRPRSPARGSTSSVNALFELCPPAPEPPSEDDDGLVEFLVYRPRPDARGGFRILRTDRGFRVTGSAPRPDELEDALRAAGAKTGSEVEVDGETLILS